MKTRRSLIAASLLGLLAAGCEAPAPSVTPSITPYEPIAEAPVAAIVAAQEAGSAADRIKADVDWLADDARAGREAGTAGYDAAASYVAQRLAAIGVAPGGDGGSWYQAVPMRAYTSVLEASRLSITGADGEKQTFTHLDDFTSFAYARTPNFEIVDAPAVFAGYGVYAPELGHDDFEGLDLTGKIVVYLTGAPNSFDSEVRAHFGSGSLTSTQASARGAIGTFPVMTLTSQKVSPWEDVIHDPTSISMTWIHPDGQPETSGPNLKGGALLNPEKAPMLFEGAPRALDDILAEADAEGGAPKGFDLAVTLSIAAGDTFEDIASPNVVGVIRGADPSLADEYVVMSAHLDHVGVNEDLVKEGKDGIYNGAMDNALGVAVLLQVAREITANPPARSVIILAVTAEEKGLLGADYYAHFPTVPIENIVANVNLDMPLMLHSFTDMIAFGAERSTLGPIVRAAAESAGLALSPDPLPEQGIFTRSDHYRFVEKGVPAVYLFPGFANGGGELFQDFFSKHYHEPSDESSLPILYDDVARFAAVNAEVVRKTADAPQRPAWNEGDFFGDLFATGTE